jgi:hypothetical protein
VVVVGVLGFRADEFPHYFKELPDHRQAGKVDYPLPEVLLLILLAVLRGRRRSLT